jgi:hypothetical protein
MDIVTVSQGLVKVLVDYLRTPESDRTEIPGVASVDQALRLVDNLMQTGGKRFTDSFDQFRNDPDTFEDATVRLLVRLLSDNPVAADQAIELLSQCQRARNAATGGIVVEQQARAIKFGGIGTGSQNVVVGGNIKDITVSGERFG